jgi:hypothetical protein
MATRKRQAKKATSKKAKRARVPLSNPGTPRKAKTMATKKKRKSGKRKLHGAAAVAHAKAHGKKRTNPGKPRRGKAKRRRSSGALSVTTRVRRNPPSLGLKKVGMMAAMVIVGGGAGVLAARQVEAHVAQPPLTLGLLEIGLGTLGLFAALKMGSTCPGLGFAAGAGANGALAMAARRPGDGGAGAGHRRPRLNARRPGAPARRRPQRLRLLGRHAVGRRAAEADDDFGGAEGLAAIEEATEIDEDGNPTDDAINPHTGSTSPTLTPDEAHALPARGRTSTKPRDTP